MNTTRAETTDGMEPREFTALELFALRVASGVTGETTESLANLLCPGCQSPGAMSGASPIAGASPSETTGWLSEKASPGDYIALIEAIMEIMLMLIEQCPQPQFVRNVGAPSRFLQVWFRVRFVRPALRPAYGGWEFDVSQEMIDQARTAGEAEREQIYQDATKPDFSVI